MAHGVAPCAPSCACPRWRLTVLCARYHIGAHREGHNRRLPMSSLIKPRQLLLPQDHFKILQKRTGLTKDQK